jgi:hypothetical protein
MATFQGENIKDGRYVIDGNQYVKCTFESCVLVFSAKSPVKFIECVFGKEVSWSLAGSAALTVNFMASLYHGAGAGGRLLVERTFEHIRKARPRRRTPETPLN